jgi:hypothetical protein
LKDCNHIAATAEDNDLEKDENSVIAATWHFHQLLDGMNTVNPITDYIPLVAKKAPNKRYNRRVCR